MPAAVVHHVGSAVAGRHSEFAVYHGHRHLVWTWWKDMLGASLSTYLAHHVALNGATLVHFAARGLGAPVLQAKRDAFGALPAVLRRRRLVQLSRQRPARDLSEAMAKGWKTIGVGRHL